MRELETAKNNGRTVPPSDKGGTIWGALNTLGMRNLSQNIVCAVLAFGCGCVAPKPARFDTVAVYGSPDFQRQITNALLLLKTKVPFDYVTVTNEIGIIQQAEHSGMRAWTKPPTFDLTLGSAFYSLTWCAASIAHDSTHSKLYHDYLRQNPKARRVPDSAWKGQAVEMRCSEDQVRVLKEIGAPVHEINWCTDTNKYWEVKYRDRYW